MKVPPLNTFALGVKFPTFELWRTLSQIKHPYLSKYFQLSTPSDQDKSAIFHYVSLKEIKGQVTERDLQRQLYPEIEKRSIHGHQVGFEATAGYRKPFLLSDLTHENQIHCWPRELSAMYRAISCV